MLSDNFQAPSLRGLGATFQCLISHHGTKKKVPPTDEPMSANDHHDSIQGSGIAKGMATRSRARKDSSPDP